MTTHRPRISADSAPAPRYAIYWAPPKDSVLAQLGSAWLGRCADPEAAADELPPRPAIAGYTADQLQALTAEPRRYALHATLKPPFALSQGRHVDELREDLARFAARQPTFTMPRLRLAPVGRRFLALIPSASCPPLDALAAACVTGFDSYRRPATATELSRRRAAGLAGIEDAHLRRWGYPYVLNRFRFHVTLSGPLHQAALGRLQAALAILFAPAAAAPTPITDIALFVEPAPDEPFMLAARFPLAGGKPNPDSPTHR
jgi:putative phosphonate metabolism protein